MQTMSQDVPKIRQKERLLYIEKNLLFQTQEELAEELHVSRKTVQRDIEKWKAKGGFKRFLIKEFFELYGQEKVRDPSQALNRIMTFLIREEAKEALTGPTTSIKTEIEHLIKISRVEICNNSSQSQS